MKTAILIQSEDQKAKNHRFLAFTGSVILTILFSLVFLQSNAASSLHLTLWNQGSFVVELDRTTYPATSVFTKDNLSEGRHLVKVTQVTAGQRGKTSRERVVYNGYIDIPQDTMVKATVQKDQSLTIDNVRNKMDVRPVVEEGKEDVIRKGDRTQTGSKGDTSNDDVVRKGDRTRTGSKGDTSDDDVVRKGDRTQTGTKGDTSNDDVVRKGDKTQTGSKGDTSDDDVIRKGDRTQTGSKGDTTESGSKGDKTETVSKGEREERPSRESDTQSESTTKPKKGDKMLSEMELNILLDKLERAPAKKKKASLAKSYIKEKRLRNDQVEKIVNALPAKKEKQLFKKWASKRIGTEKSAHHESKKKGSKDKKMKKEKKEKKEKKYKSSK